MKRKPYPAYKPSGVEWLGEIPEHWSAFRLKHAFWLQRGHDLPVTEFCEGEYPVCGSNGRIGYHNQFTTKGPGVTIGRSGSVGEINYIDMNYWAHNTALYVKEFYGTIPRYIFYLLKTLDVRYLSEGTAVGTLNRNYIHDLLIGIPAAKEQQAIAAFLDRETSRIDELIAKKQRQIELLQEKRSALISHVVTKGLDPNVKMKDSGIEWLGEIPEHWEVRPLKHIKAESPNAFVDGPFGSNLKTIHFVDNGDVYVVESEFATRGTLNPSNLKTITFEHFETVRRSETHEGDIIIAKIGAYFGLSNILPKLLKRALVSGNSMKLTVNRNICLVQFIHYQLLNQKWSGAIDLLAGTTAQPALSLGGMNSLKLILPPVKEQSEIVSFLKVEERRLESLSVIVKKSIDLLREYRTALISAAVTGKIDVREEALAS